MLTYPPQTYVLSIFLIYPDFPMYFPLHDLCLKLLCKNNYEHVIILKLALQICGDSILRARAASHMLFQNNI